MAATPRLSVPKLSVVIPVYNEEAVLPTLFGRLYPALDALGISYEIVFVNDGSRDRSVAVLREQFSLRPRHTRVVLFHANFGQHSAVMAGLAYARGEYVITLDADLQNPPEEIGKLVGMLDQGYDYVGTIRQQRQDSWWRRWFSKRINKMRELITPVRITDQGCMMRGYARSVVAALNQTREVNTFIPALASLYATKPVEVPIAHEERFAGRSKYSMYSLIRLNFDLITGFSVVPLQLFSMAGMTVALFSALFVLYLFVRRIIVGPEAEGVFTLFALVFFLIGVALFGIGLLGEYVGPHLRPGTRAAALHRRGGPRGRRRGGRGVVPGRGNAGTRSGCLAVTRAVVFAYSEVGVRCVQELLAQGVEIPLLFTHADDPGREPMVRQRAAAGRGARPAGRDAGRPQYAGMDRGGGGRESRLCVLVLLSPPAGQGLAGSAAPRSAQYARLAAAEIPGQGAGALGHSQRRDRDRRQPALHGGKARRRRARGSAVRAHRGE